jgi:hypothetical protein
MDRFFTFHHSTETWHWTGLAQLLVVIHCLLLGCSTQDCQQTCDGDLPITGALQVSYDGAIGRFPSESIDIQVINVGSDYAKMSGCGCGDNRFWWIEFTVQKAENVSTPVQFDNSNQNSAWATAFLMSCSESSCLPSNRRRTWFEAPRPSTIPPNSAATGTLQALDTTTGVLMADFTLAVTSTESSERGTFVRTRVHPS